MAKKTSTNKKTAWNHDDLQKTIEDLQKKLKEQEDIAKRAQSDYLHLKIDMDALVTRTQQQQQTQKIDTLIQVWKLLLPVVWQFKVTIWSMNKETQESQLWKALTLMYQKMLEWLKQLHIYPIDSQVWDEPDVAKHMPLWTQEAPKKSLAWKILAEVESGYIYKHESVETVIIPAKIIVWV